MYSQKKSKKKMSQSMC